MNEIAERVARLRERLEARAVPRWGRAPEIIAVTKTVPVERILQLSGTGIRRLGENRVQEILSKRAYLPPEWDVEMIGRLQRNKVKGAVRDAAMIQSLDSRTLAEEIDRRAKEAGRVMPVLIQVNIGREPQKGGVPEEEVLPFAREAAGLSGLSLRGLMAVMPDLSDREALRPLFVRMRALFERLQDEAIAGTQITELSMGMSGDAELAAEEGATCVRVGSAIFGARTAGAVR